MTEIVSDGEFLSWKQHPTTIKFLKYLDDHRIQVGKTIGDIISSGNAPSEYDLTHASVQCETLCDVLEIEPTDINTFYTPSEEDKEKDNADSGS